MADIVKTLVHEIYMILIGIIVFPCHCHVYFSDVISNKSWMWRLHKRNNKFIFVQILSNRFSDLGNTSDHGT